MASAAGVVAHRLWAAESWLPPGRDEAEEEEQHYEDLAAPQHATVLDGHGGQFGVRAGHGGQFAECAGSRRNYRLLAGGIGVDGARRWRRGFSLRLDIGRATRPSDRRDGTLLQLGGWPAHRHFAAPGALLAVVSGSRTRCEPSDPSPRPRGSPTSRPWRVGPRVAARSGRRRPPRHHPERPHRPLLPRSSNRPIFSVGLTDRCSGRFAGFSVGLFSVGSLD